MEDAKAVISVKLWKDESKQTEVLEEYKKTNSSHHRGAQRVQHCTGTGNPVWTYNSLLKQTVESEKIHPHEINVVLKSYSRSTIKDPKEAVQKSSDPEQCPVLE